MYPISHLSTEIQPFSERNQSGSAHFFKKTTRVFLLNIGTNSVKHYKKLVETVISSASPPRCFNISYRKQVLTE